MKIIGQDVVYGRLTDKMHFPKGKDCRGFFIRAISVMLWLGNVDPKFSDWQPETLKGSYYY